MSKTFREDSDFQHKQKKTGKKNKNNKFNKFDKNKIIKQIKTPEDVNDWEEETDNI